MAAIGIKAGSSVFASHDSYVSVANMIEPLLEKSNQIYFVVSAVKGETDRTIDAISRRYSTRTGIDDSILRNALDDSLRGEINQYTEIFNNHEVATRLVHPEMRSVDNLVTALHDLNINAVAMEHGCDYPLLGVNDGNFLYATPDIISSREFRREYDANVIVVPGFGVRTPEGEVMCTGRGSSDLTLVQIAQVYDLNRIIYWKDTGGFWRSPDGPKEGVYQSMSREEAISRSGEKVLDSRVYDFAGEIQITSPGRISGGTLIEKPLIESEKRYAA